MVLRIFLILALLAPLSAAHAQDLVTFETDALAIQTDDQRHEFTVELAVTPRQHAQGLMFRKSLAPDAGMLFIYPYEQPAAFWMKNTFIPLDMIFIAADGTIVNIAKRTIPLSTKPVRSKGRVLGVLELNSGTTGRLGIAPGDHVLYETFGTAPAQE